LAGHDSGGTAPIALTAASTPTPPKPSSCHDCSKLISEAKSEYCLTQNNYTTYNWLKSSGGATKNYSSIYLMNGATGNAPACHIPHYGHIYEFWNSSTGIVHEYLLVVQALNNASINASGFQNLTFTYIPLYQATVTVNETFTFDCGNWTNGTNTTGCGSGGGPSMGPAPATPAAGTVGPCLNGKNESFTDSGSTWTSYSVCIDQHNTSLLFDDLGLTGVTVTTILAALTAICEITGLFTLGGSCLPAIAAIVATAVMGLTVGYLKYVDNQGDDRGLTFHGTDEDVCALNFYWWKWGCTTIFQPPLWASGNLPAPSPSGG
jgi:hypothetical protein